MPSTAPTIAVLDDEPKMRLALRRLLHTHGFVVEEYDCAGDLLAALEYRPADCLVLDLHMPEVSGFDVLESLMARRISTPVVVITGHDELGAEKRSRVLGASAFLTKPVADSVLVRAIETAIRLPES